jgi:hypothetical protein
MKPGLTAPRQWERRWPFFFAAAVLIFLAWLLGRSSPLAGHSAPDADSYSYNLLVGGALPWFLQWAGVVCAILGCPRLSGTRFAEL